MARSFILAGAPLPITMLVCARCPRHAQQPMQRVQSASSNAAAVQASAHRRFRDNLGCVLRVEGMPEPLCCDHPQGWPRSWHHAGIRRWPWGVYAPVARLGPAISRAIMPARKGSAPSASASAVYSWRLGHSDRVLQPLSVQGQVGLSCRGRAGKLELRPGR